MSTAAAPLAPPFAADTPLAPPASAVPIPDDCRFCPDCFYDLRAHPPGKPCPECGHRSPANCIELFSWPSAVTYQDYFLLCLVVLIAISVLDVKHYLYLYVAAYLAPLLFMKVDSAVQIYPWGIAFFEPAKGWRIEHWQHSDRLEIRRGFLGHRLTVVLGSQHHKAATERFSVRLPSHRAAPIADATARFISHSPARPALDLANVARQCHECGSAIPELTATACPACSADIRSNYLSVPIYRPRVPRLAAAVVSLALVVSTIVLLVQHGTGLRSPGNSPMSDWLGDITFCLVVWGFAWFLYLRHAGPIVWRIAPAGEQLCRPNDPPILARWNATRPHVFSPLALESHRMTRSPWRSSTWTLVSRSTAQALAIAISHFKQPPSAQRLGSRTGPNVS